MQDVWVTKCFHRFCENCIKGKLIKSKNENKYSFFLESVNASHRCPLCNQGIQQDDIQRDAQYNTLLGLNTFSFFFFFI